MINLILLSIFVSARQFSVLKGNKFVCILYAYISVLILIWLIENTFIHISPAFDNQVIFSNYLSFLVIVMLCVPKPDSLTYKVTDGLLFISVFAIAAINSARTGILVLCVAGIIIVIQHYATYLNKKLVLAFFSATLICGLFFLKFSSSLGRYFILKNSLALVAKYPFGGVGLNHFSFHYNLQQAEYFEKNNGTEIEKYLADNIYTPNNEILQLLIELGGICFILIFLFWLKVIYEDLKSAKKNRPSSYIWYTSVLILFLISYPLHNSIFAYTLLISWFFLPTITPPKQVYLSPKKISFVLALPLLILISCLSFYVIQFKHLNEWKNTEYNDDISEFSYKKYDAIEPGIYYNDKFLFKYSQVLYSGGQFTKAESTLNKLLKYRCSIFFLIYRSDIEFAAHHYQEAEKTLKLAINIAPNKFITRSKMMYYYLNTKDTLQAKKQAALILKLPVKVSSQIITDIKGQCVSLLKN
ncbi:O-antigen ligase family protein [Mucilaginibacter sp. HMF5004]|uniref:O-antigen ligase family protein n=1 Tax=Mucilaginibacter rivuli TaxID=2857527 RepID=UPI001C5DCDEB|nr:O-antigen ligase family protein [Mucilaginibacter rivuli]MBW4889960.1 O-antigen ligase family protein [Mucilaginibacter rivuli]